MFPPSLLMITQSGERYKSSRTSELPSPHQKWYRYAFSNTEKANAITAGYAKQFSLNEWRMRSLSKKSQTLLLNMCSLHSHTPPKTTALEIVDIISKLRANKCPGLDDISN